MQEKFRNVQRKNRMKKAFSTQSLASYLKRPPPARRVSIPLATFISKPPPSLRPASQHGSSIHLQDATTLSWNVLLPHSVWAKVSTLPEQVSQCKAASVRHLGLVVIA